MIRRLALASVLAVLVTGGFASAQTAPTIVQEWSTVAVPTPPPLKSVTVDAATTAYLNLDWLWQLTVNKPRPTAALPTAAKLLASARAHRLLVINTRFPGPTAADAMPPTAPIDGEQIIVALDDKFINTDLDQMLKAKGIKTVIVTGVTAEGAVLYTATHAAALGYNVIVPIDAMASSIAPYGEQEVIWQLAVVPVYSSKITLTTSDRISF